MAVRMIPSKKKKVVWPEDVGSVAYLVMWKGRVMSQIPLPDYDAAYTQLEKFFKQLPDTERRGEWKDSGWILEVTAKEHFRISRTVPAIKYALEFLESDNEAQAARVARTLDGRRQVLEYERKTDVYDGEEVEEDDDEEY